MNLIRAVRNCRDFSIIREIMDKKEKGELTLADEDKYYYARERIKKRQWEDSEEKDLELYKQIRNCSYYVRNPYNMGDFLGN